MFHFTNFNKGQYCNILHLSKANVNKDILSIGHFVTFCIYWNGTRKNFYEIRKPVCSTEEIKNETNNFKDYSGFWKSQSPSF